MTNCRYCGNDVVSKWDYHGTCRRIHSGRVSNHRCIKCGKRPIVQPSGMCKDCNWDSPWIGFPPGGPYD